jgi:hypothetical protein
MRLVVATRLQAQHSSFQLRTLSNTSSVPMNIAQGSFHNFLEGNALSILQLLSQKVPGRTSIIQDNVAIWTSSPTS